MILRYSGSSLAAYGLSCHTGGVFDEPNYHFCRHHYLELTEEFAPAEVGTFPEATKRSGNLSLMKSRLEWCILRLPSCVDRVSFVNGSYRRFQRYRPVNSLRAKQIQRVVMKYLLFHRNNESPSVG
jgi:hypothetical protein